MKLTVIGHWGGYPAAGGATSAYLLEKDGYTLLIDAGSGSLSKVQNYTKVTDINAVVLSHYHNDHIADIGVLQYAWLVQSYIQDRKTVLPIYGHTDDQEGFESLSHRFTKGVAYDPKKQLEVGPFSVTFQKTDHPVPCYGMRITDGESAIVYTADTSFKEEWISFAEHADLLITDCNFYAGQNSKKAGHMTSEEGARIAHEAGVGELVLSHLPHFGDHKDLIKEAEQHFSGIIRLAEEGLAWEKSH
ncbi:MBL fold metallo-hydrolase [Virgibacillus kekensis]|uniref:MBL fold metallo-hydrolase n=1 Tax=Virgibacillus kekensis TaxID=202261 RepID=A0ABV9DLZ1_9BACI